jgi:PAS domain S-box-containing protein
VRPSRPSEISSEAALEESAIDLYENAPCGYLSTDPDGLIVRVNRTFLEWTGHSREALVGIKRLPDVLTAGGRIYYETHYAPLLRMQGAVREIAVDIVRADGSRLPVLLNATTQTDASGALRGVRTTVFDATARRRYERELMASRDRERAALVRAERLERTATALAGAPDAETIARLVVDEVALALDAEAAGMALLDRDGRLRGVLADGDAGEDLVIEAEAVFDEAAGWVRVPLAAPMLGGVLWVRFAAARELSADDRAFVCGLAAQATLALERSRLFDEQRSVAHALQQSLLGTPPPEDSRFSVASLYRPAVQGLEVGGDWHDTFLLPDGRVAIAVGDVVGRGLVAATAMGQLRSAVRALAGAELGPAGVLGRLDTFVRGVEPARYATLAYAEIDPDRGAVTYACAGHLPPVWLAPGAAPELLMGGRSTPLGVPPQRGRRGVAEMVLEPGAALLLYTDGLVERRREAIDAALDRLLEALAARAGTPPDALLDALAGTLLVDEQEDDDVCALLFTRR